MDNFTAKNWNSMIRPVALEAESESLRNDYGIDWLVYRSSFIVYRSSFIVISLPLRSTLLPLTPRLESIQVRDE